MSTTNEGVVRAAFILHHVRIPTGGAGGCHERPAAALKITGSSIFALLFSSQAYAEPIVITSGSLVAFEMVANLDARAKDFRMIAAGDFTSGDIRRWSQCHGNCSARNPH